jgi:hypothetical protein
MRNVHGRVLDVFDELLVVLSFVVAGLAECLHQPRMLHELSPHGPLLIVCFGNSPAPGR